jgi:drug/metabolite transporter (DMT)-like permease
VLAVAQRSGDPDPVVRALGFAALIAADLALVIATRGRPRHPTSTRNRAAGWMFGIVGALLGAAILIPPLRTLFGFGLPGAESFAAAILAGGLPVLAVGRIVKTKVRGRR